MKTRQVKMLAVGAVSLAALSPQTGRADNIAQVAMSAPDFSTLVTAVKAAGLAPALMGKGSLTVFAPTNAAFAKLPAGTVENLLKPENKATLVSILKYHVLPMRVSAKKVMAMKSGANAKTLNGEMLAVRMMHGVYLDPFMSGKAKVVKTDIAASNGVIHAIDTVLIPPTVAQAMMKKP